MKIHSTFSLRYIALCSLSLCGLLAQSALAQSANQQTSPLVRVGKTATAPVIDGKLNDAAWRQSIAGSEFTVTGSKHPAAEPTQVRFAYDRQNFYVAWRCTESLLTIAQQRMHEVRTNAKVHDADVFSDDSALLFVQPAPDGVVYEFDINSLGTLFDARSQRNDLWGARDAAWNGGAQAAGVQEDGFWTGELSIPWKAFGLNAPPAVETAWEIGLARRAVGRGESSAWNQSESPSIHAFSNWGRLVFGNMVPGLTAQMPSNFEAGKSILAVQVAPAELAPRLAIEATVSDGNKTQTFQSPPASQKTATIEIPVAAASDTPCLQWSVKGDGGIDFYRSPQLLLSAQSTLAHLKISTDKSWKLFLNATPLGAGDAAQNQDLVLPLVDGANDIVVETQSGAAKLELIPPSFAPAENLAWRTAAASDGKVPDGTDRRTWKIAPQKNGVIGTPGAPAFLQHTLLWKTTPHYPVMEPAFYIAEGTAQQITFLAEGVKDIRFDDWELSLAVPPEFEVIGSSGFYGKQIAGKTQFQATRVGETVIGGKTTTLYHIAADKPIVYQARQNPVVVSFEVLVRVAKKARHDATKEWRFFYWANGNQGAVSEAPQSFPVRTLPPLHGLQPKKLTWELWAGATHVYDDRVLLRDILDTARQVGFNSYQASSWKDFNDMVRSYGMKAFTLINFKDSRTAALVRPYLAAHPDEKLVDKSGKPHNDYLCTTKVLGDAWPMFAASIREWTLKAEPDEVDYDYEYPPFNPPHACFCKRCLVEFRKFSNFGANIELSPAIIQQNYALQWVDFMAYRTAVLLQKMKVTVHQVNPQVLFTAYSGYYDAKNNTTKTRYGMDWDLIGKMQAVDQAGMGYGRPLPGVKDSIAAMRGIPVKFGELLVPYDERSPLPVAPLTRATLLRRSLDATGGVLIYARNAMDGRSWQAVAETTRLVATYEDAFAAAPRTTLPGQDEASVQVLKDKTETLVCVLNEGKVPRSFELQLPADAGGGTEFYSNRPVKAGEKINVTLPPGETVVYILKP